MAILVLGGSGTVGSAVVAELRRRAVPVRVLTRSAERVATLPSGVECVVGNLLEPWTIRSVFDGVEAVFLLNAVSPTETHEGLMALNGARLSGVERLVYLSIHRLDEAPHVPHFGAKLPIEAAIRASGISYAILRSNNFFQNDYWYRDALLAHGIYPQPLGDIGISRVDVRDIAEAAAIILSGSSPGRETYNLVGPSPQTGESTARIWSEVLARPVRYAGNDLEAWEQQSLRALPEWMVFDLKLMYAFFQQHGLLATPADIERLTALLGRQPRSFDAFARETAAQWRN